MRKQKKRGRTYGPLTKILIWILSALMLFAIGARLIHLFKYHF